MTQEEIINALEKQEREMQRRINNPKLYNAGNMIARVGINLGKILTKVVPYIFAGTVALESNSSVKTYLNTPYVLNESENAYKKGKKIELVYSTEWKHDGDYYRMETLYNLEQIDMDTIEQILKGKADNKISEEKIICDTPEEGTYEKPTITFKKIPYSQIEALNNDMLKEFVKILANALIIVGISHEINVLVFQKRFADKLDGVKAAHKNMDSQSLEDLEEILEVRKRNLELVKEGIQNDNKPKRK